MKTTIPQRIETIQEAESFLNALIENEEVYHPEDDANDIIWNIPNPPTESECERLNIAMEQIYAIGDFDPCEFIMNKASLSDNE